jgi:hypothetical protein
MILFKKSAVAFFFLFFLHGTSIGNGQQGISYNDLLVADDSPNYLVNGELASLAPQMRTELIRMDEEIREQKNKIDCLVGYLEKWNSQKSNWLAGVPDELDNVIKEAKECLHVTPPKTNP